MDIIAGSGLEPQLAIPVIFVVVGAVLVYLFGFQKTEEPSFEHLAILQSSSSYKNRSVNVKHNGATGAKATATTAKSKANGHVVSNGSVVNNKPQQATTTKTDKDTKAPQVKTQLAKKEKSGNKAAANKPEDFESGDWIQATSRKDKKKKSPTQADAPGSPVKESAKRSGGGAEEPKQQKSPIIVVEEGEQEIPASVLKELEAVIQKQNHSTQTSPEKKAAALKTSKGTTTSTPASSTPSSPVKKPQAEVKPVVQDKKVEEVEVKEEPAKEKEVNPKNNIAFDEMGDSWEEAKSRGTKKRRARRE